MPSIQRRSFTYDTGIKPKPSLNSLSFCSQLTVRKATTVKMHLYGSHSPSLLWCQGLSTSFILLRTTASVIRASNLSLTKFLKMSIGIGPSNINRIAPNFKVYSLIPLLFYGQLHPVLNLTSQ